MNQPTGIEAEVCADIARRQAYGMAKYPTSLKDNNQPLSVRINHAFEESADKTLYLKWAHKEAKLMEADIKRLENEVYNLEQENLDLKRELGARAEPDEPFSR